MAAISRRTILSAGVAGVALLSLGGAAIASSGKEELTRSVLERLVVRRARLGDEGLAFIAASPNLASLRSLDVTDWGVTSRSVRLLVESPHLRLYELDAHGLWTRIDSDTRDALLTRIPRVQLHC